MRREREKLISLPVPVRFGGASETSIFMSAFELQSFGLNCRNKTITFQVSTALDDKLDFNQDKYATSRTPIGWRDYCLQLIGEDSLARGPQNVGDFDLMTISVNIRY